MGGIIQLRILAMVMSIRMSEVVFDWLDDLGSGQALRNICD